MIKDKMQLQGFGNIKLPKIKGEVEIRLHNPTTGKTEIQRGENMVTNAVYDIFANNLCGCMDYRKMLPIYEQMFGGVLCFQNALNVSDADDYYIPDNSTYDSQHPESSGNTVTAHAGQSTVTDQTDDPTRGSKSAGNMSVTDGTVKLAWEWGLLEGNGDIEALALTHTDVGTGGTGSKSTAFQSISPNIPASYGANASQGITAAQPVMFIDNSGYGYTLDFSGTTITITRFPMPYTSVGLVGMLYTYVSGLQSTKTITVETSYSHYPHHCFIKSTGLLYIFYNNSKSTSANVDIINLSDWDNIPTPTHEVWSLDEPVGRLDNYGSGKRLSAQIPYSNGYVYLPQYTGNGSDAWPGGPTVGFLRVKLSNRTDQTLILPPTGATARQMISGVYNPNADHKVIVGKNFVINNGVLYGMSIASPDILPIHEGDSSYRATFFDQGVGLVGMNYQNTNSICYPSISKFYLATKFNLNSKVTKTPSQSMIVTYTLTEVDPNANE